MTEETTLAALRLNVGLGWFFKENMMIIDDEYLAAEIENALGIIECAFQNAIDNEDSSELEDEIKRGISEILAAQDKVMGILDGDA